MGTKFERGRQRARAGGGLQYGYPQLEGVGWGVTNGHSSSLQRGDSVETWTGGPPWRNPDFSSMHQRKQNMEVYRFLKSQVQRDWEEEVTNLREEEARLRARLQTLRMGEEEEDLHLPSVSFAASASPSETVRISEELHNPLHRQNTTESERAVWGEPPNSETISRHREANPKAVINIGGVKHEVMWRIFEAKPRTRLGRLSHARSHDDILDLVDAYSLEENEFYVDRDPGTFNCILNYYRTCKLHIIDEVCPLDFSDDLRYWMIDENFIEFCCLDKLVERRDAIQTAVAKENIQEEEELVEDFGDGYFAPYQQALWDLFEKPQSSAAAKIMSLASVAVVLVSLCGMCFNTFPWMMVDDINGEPVDNPRLGLMEAVCISFFTIEFLLRLAGSPDKKAFLQGRMNVIDSLAIAPYYITLFLMPPPELEPPDPSIILPTGLPMEEEGSGFGGIGRIMQVFRIARIMRIFKLARRSVGLQSIAYTVKTSYKDLGLLFSLVFMGMLVFGSLAFYIENGEEDTGFYSIPQGMWWALQTLTSVGYGDFTCTTVLGKLIGSACGVCGVLVMALPIPIVVDNFADYYSEQKKLEAKEFKREAQAVEDQWEMRKAILAKEQLLLSIASTTKDWPGSVLGKEAGARENGYTRRK